MVGPSDGDESTDYSESQHDASNGDADNGKCTDPSGVLAAVSVGVDVVVVVALRAVVVGGTVLAVVRTG